MRNLIVGIVVGVVIGIVVGATVVAPRLKLPVQSAAIAPQSHELSKLSGAPRPAQLDDSALVTHWRMASAHASTLSHMGGLALRIEENIFKASDGRLRIKFFEPGTLVAPDMAIDAVRSGAIEAAFATPGLWAKRNPALHLFSAIPFGPPIQEYLAWLHADGQAIMTEIFKQLGIHGLPCGLLAPEGSGWFRKPVNSLEQLKSLRVGMSGLGGEVLARLGTQVLPIAEGDVFVALERGLIDGAEAAQPTIDLQLGLHRLARHYYFPGWHQPATLLTLIINLDSWIKLSSAAKIQLESICGDNLQRGLAVSEAGQFNALKSLIAEGVRIETWSPEIISALRAAWATEAAAKSRQSPDFTRAWNSLQRFREEYAIWREIGRPEVPDGR